MCNAIGKECLRFDPARAAATFPTLAQLLGVDPAALPGA